MREGERARKSPRERESRTLPGQAFIAFLGTLHGGWSSFIVHRFTLGIYLLQITKERMLLITSKKRIFANAKEKVVELVTLRTWEV